jgi:hypothetical protein
MAKNAFCLGEFEIARLRFCDSSENELNYSNRTLLLKGT